MKCRTAFPFPCLALLALAPLPIAPAAGFAAPGPQGPQEPEQHEEPDSKQDDRARELNRILHLTDGRALRAKARFADGRWQIRVERAWQDLPSALVERIELEQDVLRAAAGRERELASGDVDALAEHAAWLHANGLVAESLAALDRVLDRAPHHRGALELLRARHFVAVPSLDVPEDERDAAAVRLFDWAIVRSPAVQELAIVEFAKLRDREGFVRDVALALGSHSIERRALATRLLGRLFPGQDVQRLLVHALLDSSEAVRKGASQALAAAGEPGLTLPLIRALESSPSARVRSQAAQALGHMGFAASVPALVSHLATPIQRSSSSGLPRSNIFIGRQFAYIQDFDVEVAQFQAIADPKINVLLEGSVLEAAVVSAREGITPLERATVRRALSQITGADPGHTTRAWLAWWEDQATAPAPPTETPR